MKCPLLATVDRDLEEVGALLGCLAYIATNAHDAELAEIRPHALTVLLMAADRCRQTSAAVANRLTEP